MDTEKINVYEFVDSFNDKSGDRVYLSVIHPEEDPDGERYQITSEPEGVRGKNLLDRVQHCLLTAFLYGAYTNQKQVVSILDTDERVAITAEVSVKGLMDVGQEDSE